MFKNISSMDLDIESFYEYDDDDDDLTSFPWSPEGPEDEDILLTQNKDPSDDKSGEERAEVKSSGTEAGPSKSFKDKDGGLPCSPIPMDVDDDEGSFCFSNSQSQRLYSGLLSQPEFDVFDVACQSSKVWRDVKLSVAFQPLTLQDFLSRGPQTRPARGKRRNKRDASSVSYRLNRKTKTFLRRFNEYKPILENKLSCNSVWSRYKRIKSVKSMSKLGTTDEDVDNEGSQEEIKWGWDDDQGIAFRVYDQPIVLVGYIVKQVPPDLNRLHERCQGIGVIPIPLKRADDWCLFLEDETGRIRIGLTKQREENVNFNEIVSGIPAAIVGTSSKGRFWVQDILFATPNDPEWPIVEERDAVEMVFVSGLNFGEDPNYAHFDLLMDYLQGLVGSSVEQSKILKQKTRVFFVGNIFSKKMKWDPERGDKLAVEYTKNVSRLDDMLEDLARTMEVFIMPGKLDLTHHETLPQPPFHRQLFPTSAVRPTFQRLSNPAKVTVSFAKPPEEEELLLQNSILIEESQLDIVLTSGTNVSDTMEKCEIECPLYMSAKLLEWGHLHPTSIQDHDLAEELYCLKGSLPHLFVVGGLCEFGEKIWNGVRIIGVPSFAETGIAVTLTKSCDVVPVNFKVCNFSRGLPFYNSTFFK